MPRSDTAKDEAGLALMAPGCVPGSPCKSPVRLVGHSWFDSFWVWAIPFRATPLNWTSDDLAEQSGLLLLLFLQFRRPARGLQGGLGRIERRIVVRLLV